MRVKKKMCERRKKNKNKKQKNKLGFCLMLSFSLAFSTLMAPVLLKGPQMDFLATRDDAALVRIHLLLIMARSRSIFF